MRTRARLDDSLLANVARVYRANLAHAPTVAVRRHFGLASDRTARYWVKVARARGHLGASLWGKAGEAT